MTEAPPASAPAPPSALQPTLQGNVMTSGLIPPSVTINGYPVPTRYGVNVIPLHAGPTRVDVSCQWMRTYGQASLAFQARPGQTAAVCYAPPWHQFTTGSIGFEKQTRRGAAPMFAVLGLVVFVVLAMLIGAAA